MTATTLNFIRKEPAVQAIVFDTTSVQTMEDSRDWVYQNLPPGCTVNLQTAMGGLLSWTGPGIPWVTVRAGEYVVKDSNDKLFKMSKELLDAFYDQVV